MNLINSVNLRKDRLFQNISKTGSTESVFSGAKEKSDAMNNNTSNNSKGIKAIWHNFASSTSLHGLFNVQDSNRNVIVRLVWCICVVFMIVSLGYVLIGLLLKYLEYPFTSVWSIRQESAIDLPTITMCPYNVYNHDKISQSPAALRFFEKDNWYESLTNVEEEEILNMTHTDVHTRFGFSKDEIVIHVNMYQGRIFLNVSKDIVRTHIGERGVCFTLHDFRDKTLIEEKITTDHTLQVFLDLRKHEIGPNKYLRGLFVYLHKFGTTNLRMRPLLLEPGLASMVVFKQTDYTFLPLPYKSYGNHGCVEADKGDFKNPLRIFPIYTRLNCLDELFQNFSAGACGCVDERFTEILQKKECTLREQYDCVNHLMYWFDTDLIDKAEYYAAICPYSCNFSVIDTSLSSLILNQNLRQNSSNEESEFIHLMIQAKTTNVESIKHVPELTWDTILASVGGYLGFFLGASMLTAVEIMDFILSSLKYFLWDKCRETKV